MKKLYVTYENGTKEVFTESQLETIFNNDSELDEQKADGTTFETWLDEMLHMQIYNEISYADEMTNTMKVNAYINATLKNGINIDGQIDSITENGFMIDDNITGDIFLVNNDEIETINEYID